MRAKLVTILGAGVLALSAVARAADEDPGCKTSGNIGIGVQGVNVNALDPSKFKEYRDMSNGVAPTFEFKGRCADNYFNIYGENLGRDDQYVDLNGGQYGLFKYRLYDNNLRHYFGSGAGALTPYAGAGGNNLSAPINVNGIINKIPANWNTFDNSYKRQDIGGMFEFSNKSPFYVRLDGNQVKREGIKVLAGSIGTSPGQGFMDLPSPVDFTDNNISGEVGYQTKQGHIALNVMQNKFTNGQSLLNWTNGFFQGTDTTVLPPESTLTKVGLNGNYRQLPGESTFAGRMTYSKTTNSVAILPTTLAAANTFPATGSNSPGFNGDVVNKSVSLSLSSHPLPKLDTRLYYNFNDKNNNSTEIVFNPTVASGLQCTNTSCVAEVYNYKKNNYGFEGGYRINSQNKVGFGIDYTDANYTRVDYIRDIDRKYLVEWKNSSFDSLDTRTKYQRLVRSGTFVDTGNFNTYQRRFDLASVTQDLGKVTFDATPRPLLNVGLEVIYKHNDYSQDQLQLGRTKDQRGELYASIGYGDPNSFRVMLFGDAEYTKFDSLHRVGAVPANGNPNSPPAGGPPNTSYTYGGIDRDKSFLIGLGADWVPREKWKVNSSATWAKTQGNVDFTSQSGAIIAAPGLLPVTNYDNTTTITLNVKGTYSYTKNWDFTGGYAYQHYSYSDISFDGYKYVLGSTSSGSMASGLYAFPSSNSNTVYGMVKYKFQ
jgi:hypothetical protein